MQSIRHEGVKQLLQILQLSILCPCDDLLFQDGAQNGRLHPAEC